MTEDVEDIQVESHVAGLPETINNTSMTKYPNLSDSVDPGKRDQAGSIMQLEL
jgi:hypothetical protein